LFFNNQTGLSPFWGYYFLGRQLFDELADVHGVLVRLPGEFVSAEMISFTVRDSGGGMGMGREVVEFRDSIVQTLWHDILLSGRSCR
jgi:hypothetical protein